VSAFKLEFGSPRHGWLDVTVSGPGGTIELGVSDVPGDSLRMLAAAASNAVDGHGGGEVTWFLEPAKVRWFFRPATEGLAIWVQGDRQDERCIASGSTGEICAVVWRAMRRLEVDPAWHEAGDGRVWSHPFPHREVEYLGEELRRRRAEKAAG
jgi:hypothetical protein